MKEIKQNLGFGIIIIITLWMAITTYIQAFSCPKMTHTEIFINIPKSFVLNFDKCK